MPDWTLEEVATARRLWDQGTLTAAQVAERLGRTKNSFLGLAFRRGFDRRREGNCGNSERRGCYSLPAVKPPSKPRAKPVRKGCHWVTAVDVNSVTYCGEKCVKGTRYCQHHHDLTWTDKEVESNA